MYVPHVTENEKCCDEGKHLACPFSNGRYQCWEKCACKRATPINVNGETKKIVLERISYDQIVALADSGRSKECLHSVSYSYKTLIKDDKDEAVKVRITGTVIPGADVAVHDGMVINAFVTDGA